MDRLYMPPDLTIDAQHSTLSHNDSFEKIIKCAEYIDSFLNQDRTYKDLGDRFAAYGNEIVTVSGNNKDYPNQDNFRSIPRQINSQDLGASLFSSSFNQKAEPQTNQDIGDFRHVPLPPELREQIGRVQKNCSMGIFPEIDRAWLTVDSDIFIWKYTDSSDLAYFDALKDTILCVHLAKPKDGIFQKHICYVLCLVTNAEVSLLGTTFSKPVTDGLESSNIDEMHVLPEALFNIVTEGIQFCSICSTKEGRIFLGSNTNELYEFAYQAKNGWFSKKCELKHYSTFSLASYILPSFVLGYIDDVSKDQMIKISIDSSRNILYTLSKKSKINMFDLGMDGLRLSHVVSCDLETLTSHFSKISSGDQCITTSPLVDMAVLEKKDSITVQLILINAIGVRFYYKTCTLNEFGNSRPQFLKLIHVRWPPNYGRSGQIGSVTKLLSSGPSLNLILAKEQLDNDILYSVSNDNYSFDNDFKELIAKKSIDGAVWAMVEVPIIKSKQRFENESTNNKSEAPILINQHLISPKQYVILNARGTYIFSHLRPVDQLKMILLENNGPDNDIVKAFFKRNPIQALSISILLSSSVPSILGDSPNDELVRKYAIQTFFLYDKIVGSHVLNGQQQQLQYYQSRRMEENLEKSIGYSSFIGPNITHPNFIASSPVSSKLSKETECFPMKDSSHNVKQIAFFICIARILSNTWDKFMIRKDLKLKNNGFFARSEKIEKWESTVDLDEIEIVINSLISIGDFIEKNFLSKSAKDYNITIFNKNNTSKSFMDEKKTHFYDENPKDDVSISALYKFILRCSEALSLWSLICQDNFQSLIIHFADNDNLKDYLCNMTFRSYCINRDKEIYSKLIKALTEKYISDNAAIQAMSDKLRLLCPSLYSYEDAICIQASEILFSAKCARSENEKKELTQQALHLLKTVREGIDIIDVCNQFASLKQYEAIVELALSVAEKRDPNNLALQFYHSDMSDFDENGKCVYMMRMKCYGCITNALTLLCNVNDSKSQNCQPTQIQPGNRIGNGENKIDNSEEAILAEQLYKTILKCNDELMHAALYLWLLDNDMFDQLSDIDSPFLETFLRKISLKEPNNLPVIEVLAKYYEKQNNFVMAAKILAVLAETENPNIKLKDRVMYLSKAKMAAKCNVEFKVDQSYCQFINELEDKLEVATLQLQVVEVVQKLKRTNENSPSIDHILSVANSKLLDLSTIYSDIAESLDLIECKLAIFHCAGHDNQIDIDNLWRELFLRELNSVIDSSKETKMMAIRKRLQEQCNLYVNNDRFMNLDFLIPLLEQIADVHSFTHHFVVECFVELPISIVKLFGVYSRLYDGKDHKFRISKNRIGHVILWMTEYYVSTENLMQPNERRIFVLSCLDAISRYQIELEAKKNNPEIASLIAKFKHAQAILEKNTF